MTEQNRKYEPLDGIRIEEVLSLRPADHQVSGRMAISEPDALTVKSVADLLPTVRLRCLSEEAAQEVVDRCQAAPRPGRHNRARRDGDSVIITYANKLWPYNIAEMAKELGLASDSEAARVLACL